MCPALVLLLSDRTEDFSERACDLGTEILRALTYAGSGAPIVSVSGGGSQRLTRLRTASTARPRRTGSASREAISV